MEYCKPGRSTTPRKPCERSAAKHEVNSNYIKNKTTMITLKTLPYATEQQVFDQVARHLLEQKQVSTYAPDKCAYRGEAGLKCAAGCLIAEDEYNPAWENRGWKWLVEEKAVPAEHRELISELQTIHDEEHPAHWEQRLKSLAHELELKFKH